ncbi:hypothetical protein [Streptomyces sp. NBC_00005]|uniref:hypothetical protein n=1 Tax=Streptomyces sp. NBC_00005 TaxID=2903609 RepID=UPI00324A561C
MASAPALSQLADYLEQHGRATRRRLCPPASFWEAAGQHLARPDDLDGLARAARARYRLQWADRLGRRAAEAGQVRALLAQGARCERAADWAQAKVLRLTPRPMHRSNARRPGSSWIRAFFSSSGDRI